MVAVPHPSANWASAEKEVIARLNGRDAAAFESLICQHAGRWFAVARRMLGSDDDAADAVQEAYVSALGAMDRFRGESLPSTWVHRIVVNTCLMKLRARRTASCHTMDECLAAPADGDALIAEETRRVVRQCIERLPATYREVLIMRDLEEHDTHETARLLQLAPGAVKTRLHRARRALRALLELAMDEEHLALGA